MMEIFFLMVQLSGIPWQQISSTHNFSFFLGVSSTKLMTEVTSEAVVWNQLTSQAENIPFKIDQY